MKTILYSLSKKRGLVSLSMRRALFSLCRQSTLLTLRGAPSSLHKVPSCSRKTQPNQAQGGKRPRALFACKAKRSVVFGLVCCLSLSAVENAKAFPVFDAGNFAQNIITAGSMISQGVQQGKQLVNAAKQVQVQIQQYENMVKNSMAPAAWIWGAGQNLHDQFKERLNQIRNFDLAKEFQDYNQQWGDVNFYRNSPCYRFGGCSKKEEEALFQHRIVAAQAQEKANKTMIKTLDLQAKTLADEAASLKQLQNKTQNAQGQRDAIGYGTQLSGQQANQLMQIRELMINEETAQAARLQAIADREAQETAASDYLRSGEFVKSAPVAW